MEADKKPKQPSSKFRTLSYSTRPILPLNQPKRGQCSDWLVELMERWLANVLDTHLAERSARLLVVQLICKTFFLIGGASPDLAVVNDHTRWPPSAHPHAQHFVGTFLEFSSGAAGASRTTDASTSSSRHVANSKKEDT